MSFSAMMISLIFLSQLFGDVGGQPQPEHESGKSLTDIYPVESPMGLIKELLDKSIKATHRRPRKAVSSQSVVKFKREKQKRKRQYVYPSNWGEFMLYCKTGWLLQILPNGYVNGTNDLNSPYARMQIQVLSPTVVRIKGVESGRYIAVNPKGKLVSKRYPTRETVFHEEVLENYYHTLKSARYPLDKSKDWHIGIRKNGRSKRASRTKIGETCIQFLKLPFRDPFN